MDQLGSLDPFADEDPDSVLSQDPEPSFYEKIAAKTPEENLQTVLDAGPPRWAHGDFHRKPGNMKLYVLEIQGPAARNGHVQKFKELKAFKLTSYSDDGLPMMVFPTKEAAVNFAHEFHAYFLRQVPKQMDLALLRTACVYGPLDMLADMARPDPEFKKAEEEAFKRVKAQKMEEAMRSEMEKKLQPPIGAKKIRGKRPRAPDRDEKPDSDYYKPKFVSVGHRKVCAIINFTVVNRNKNSPDYMKPNTSMVGRSAESAFPTQGEDANPWSERFPDGVFPKEKIKSFVDSLSSGAIQPGMEHPLRRGDNVDLFDEVANDPSMQTPEFKAKMLQYLEKMAAIEEEIDQEMKDV